MQDKGKDINEIGAASDNSENTNSVYHKAPQADECLTDKEQLGLSAIVSGKILTIKTWSPDGPKLIFGEEPDLPARFPIEDLVKPGTYKDKDGRQLRVIIDITESPVSAFYLRTKVKEYLHWNGNLDEQYQLEVFTVNQETITVQEAAKILRIGKNQAYAAVRSGTIPAVRIGRSFRISRAALDSMMKGRSSQGTPVSAIRR